MTAQASEDQQSLERELLSPRTKSRKGCFLTLVLSIVLTLCAAFYGRAFAGPILFRHYLWQFKDRKETGDDNEDAVLWLLSLGKLGREASRELVLSQDFAPQVRLETQEQIENVFAGKSSQFWAENYDYYCRRLAQNLKRSPTKVDLELLIELGLRHEKNYLSVDWRFNASIPKHQASTALEYRHWSEVEGLISIDLPWQVNQTVNDFWQNIEFLYFKEKERVEAQFSFHATGHPVNFQFLWLDTVVSVSDLLDEHEFENLIGALKHEPGLSRQQITDALVQANRVKKVSAQRLLKSIAWLGQDSAWIRRNSEVFETNLLEAVARSEDDSFHEALWYFAKLPELKISERCLTKLEAELTDQSEDLRRAIRYLCFAAQPNSKRFLAGQRFQLPTYSSRECSIHCLKHSHFQLLVNIRSQAQKTKIIQDLQRIYYDQLEHSKQEKLKSQIKYSDLQRCYLLALVSDYQKIDTRHLSVLRKELRYFSKAPDFQRFAALMTAILLTGKHAKSLKTELQGLWLELQDERQKQFLLTVINQL